LKILLASSSNVSFEIFNSLISLSKTKNDNSKIEIAGFLTNSDRPTGRGQKSVSNEFAEWAIQFEPAFLIQGPAWIERSTGDPALFPVHDPVFPYSG